MGLHTVAAADLLAIVEDPELFGTEITCTDDLAVVGSVMGQVNQIAFAIDPDTNRRVAGSEASVVVLSSAIAEAGLSAPRAVHETSGLPWVVSWVGPADAVTRTYKVVEVVPDDTRGLVTLLLEAYAP